MRQGLTLVTGLAAALMAVELSASIVMPDVVNPARYESRSGECLLEMNPSERYGKGPATYRLTCKGREQWSGERPFTLLDAAVGDDGLVAGYAYDAGVSPFVETDVLHLLILDPAGRSRADLVMPRRMSRVIHGGPEPVVNGIVFDAEHDRVVFRVSSESSPDVWTPLRLSTGEAGPTYSPEAAGRPNLTLWVQDAKPVPGTPLTLIHWSRDDWKREQRGARFSLVDLVGREVWKIDLPTDYQAPERDEQAQRHVWGEMRTAILDVSRPMEFEIKAARSSERVRYGIVAATGGRWTVREKGREPYRAPEMLKASLDLRDVPERRPRYLGRVALGGASAAEAKGLRGIQDFDIDTSGRFGFARSDDRCVWTFVTGRTTETQTRTVKLGQARAECSSGLVAWAGGPTWLVTWRFADSDDGSVGWWVDAETGQTRPFRLAKGLSVHGLAGRPGGGVVLMTEFEKSTAMTIESETVLVWMDAQGREERRARPDADGTDSGLMSPDDIAVTSAGDVVLIDAVTHGVAVFDGQGALRKTIDLEKAWGREPGYTSGIAPDADGGFLVEDSGADTPFVRMRADGTVRGPLWPRYNDGRPTGRLFRVRAERDGAVWGSDGEALLRLADDGTVERAIGGEASTEELGEVAAIVLDGRDRIYAADRRTGAVHVFGPDGSRLYVGRPEKGDIDEALSCPSLTATDDGRVYLRPGLGLGDPVFLEFSPGGERVARHSWPDRQRLWNPATNGFWAIDGDSLAAVDAQGHTTRTIGRRADGKWLDGVWRGAVAPDGSLAVQARASGQADMDERNIEVSVHAPDGAPTRVIPVPADFDSPLAFDGRRLMVWVGAEVLLLDAQGHRVARFKPQVDGTAATKWPLFAAAGGTELWMFEGATRTIHRFEMP